MKKSSQMMYDFLRRHAKKGKVKMTYEQMLEAGLKFENYKIVKTLVSRKPSRHGKDLAIKELISKGLIEKDTSNLREPVYFIKRP